MLQITNAEEKYTYRALDSFGNLTKIKYPSGLTQEMVYFGGGKLWKESVYENSSK